MDGGIMTSRLLVDKIEGKTTAGNVVFPAGVSLQITEKTLNTNWNMSGTGETEIMNHTITPKFASSKILIMMNFALYLDGGTGTMRGDYLLKRNGTQIWTTDADLGGWGYFREGNGHYKVSNPFNTWVDSPNSTSTVTYGMFVDGHTHDAGNINFSFNNFNIVLMEIAG